MLVMIEYINTRDRDGEAFVYKAYVTLTDLIFPFTSVCIALFFIIILIIIIIIIINICSAHISTLLGAQGAETWIQTIYNDSKNNIMCRDTCTVQLQIYVIFAKWWHKMSFKQRLKSGFTITRFEFSWKMIPESRSRDRKRSITPGPFWSSFRSDMFLERKLRDWV